MPHGALAPFRGLLSHAMLPWWGGTTLYSIQQQPAAALSVTAPPDCLTLSDGQNP
ncbi:MAG: hypothetical protein ACRD0K_26735 [Egibacteraceae bacterium]